MSLTAAIRLVQSLSGSEKRFFRLNTKQQEGQKDYQQLFDLIVSTRHDEEVIAARFHEQYPSANLDNTSRYLVRTLTDCLVESRVQKDKFFQLFHGLMRVKVLQERALPEEGYKELKKIRESAAQHQQHFIEFLTYRYELDHLADAGFPDVTDTQLVTTQMKARDILKRLNHVHDHHSLFEMMKYRLVHEGQILTDVDRRKLNDLMLSEMVLMTGKMKNNFATQKLHLLFQSYFLTNIGDFSSAVKTFRELNKLFEENLALLDHPPHDYHSAINGIIANLLVLKKFSEVEYYTDRLQQLDQQVYPEYFRYQVRKTILASQLAVGLGQEAFSRAMSMLAGDARDIITAYPLVNEEKQWELYFYASLIYYRNNDKKQAHKWLGEIMNESKGQPTMLVCKATRLLNIIIHYERGDAEYIDYEIRSYRRYYRKHDVALLKTELLVFKLMQLKPANRKVAANAKQLSRLLEQVDELRHDRYEQQLLRYFDFLGWAGK